eukprot:scaffold273461_cov29-Tisochrysis_lutea.AAC.1
MHPSVRVCERRANFTLFCCGERARDGGASLFLSHHDGAGARVCRGLAGWCKASGSSGSGTVRVSLSVLV